MAGSLSLNLSSKWKKNPQNRYGKVINHCKIWELRGFWFVSTVVGVNVRLPRSPLGNARRVARAVVLRLTLEVSKASVLQPRENPCRRTPRVKTKLIWMMEGLQLRASL